MFGSKQTKSTEIARRVTVANTVPLCAKRPCGEEGERLLDANMPNGPRVCEIHGEAYDSRTGQS